MSAPNFLNRGIVSLIAIVLTVTAFIVIRHSRDVSADKVPAPSPGPARGDVYQNSVNGTSAQDLEDAPPALPSKSADRSVGERARREHDVALLEEQMKELETRKDEDRRSYAADLQFPNNPVKPLYEGLVHQKEAMTEMRAGGMGSQHPRVVVQQQVVDSITGDVDQAVIRLSDQMKSELNAQRQTLQRLR